MRRIITSVTISSFKEPEASFRCDALVDTGASHLILPKAWKEQLGSLDTIATMEFETATQARVQGEVCEPVEIQLEGFRPIYSEAASVFF